MNKDQIKGSIKEAAGKVQEKAGELLDSPKTVAKGMAKQVEGKGQKALGNMNEAAQRATSS